MKRAFASSYQCPYTKESLTLEVVSETGDEVVEGSLSTPSGRKYPIKNGIAYLINAADEIDSAQEREHMRYYESIGEQYETGLEWLFKSFGADEMAVREQMLDLLQLAPQSRVLETGCGTCRSSILIAKRLSNKGELCLQDLGSNILSLGKAKFSEYFTGKPAPLTEFSVGNACNLPYPDGYFDAAFHFGAINVFSDRKAAIAEMTRVVRPGGRVVFGDEAIAPWLKDTQYGKILCNSNPLYNSPLPLELLPENAVNPCLRWIIGNAFYLIDYTVGEGPPYLDLDLPIPGPRGGSHRTRYFGKDQT